MNLSKLATLGIITMSAIGLGMGMDAHADELTPDPVQDDTDTHGTDKQTENDNGDTAKSNAKINLIVDPDGGKKPIPPIDKGDQKDVKDPNSEDNHGTGHHGLMTIDYVSNLKFGEQKVSAEEQTYHLSSSNNGDVFTQVTDNRGTGAGWTLSVNLEDEFKSGDTVLKGAELSYPKGDAHTTVGSKAKTPSAVNQVTVNTSPQIVMAAKAFEGVGTWSDKFSKDEVTLKVPGGNIAGDYSANVVWTLTDTPAS